MACESPSSSAWTPYFDGGAVSTSSDLFWSSKSNADVSTDFSHLNDFLVDDERHAVPSSAASTQSDSDSFPASSVHHMPSWSTIGTKHSSSPVKRAGEVNDIIGTGASPGDAISPSGLSDRNSDANGLLDDMWFIPSPESGAVPAAAHGALQRKKRMHFAKQLPSSMQPNENGNGGGGSGSEHHAFTLKGAKSVPNFNRRVSSAGYTARLEDLLAEMGWPSQQAQDSAGIGAADEERDSDIGNDTIQAVGGVNNNNSTNTGNFTGSMQDNSSSAAYGNSGQTVHNSSAEQSNAPNSGSGNADALGSSQSSLSSTSGALYKRRAGSRDGIMPVPGPVAVPHRQDATAASTPSSQPSADLLNSLSGPALAQQRAASLMAQHQRLQFMADMVNAPSSSGNSNNGGQDSVKSTFSMLSDANSSPSNGHQNGQLMMAAGTNGQRQQQQQQQAQQHAMELSTSGGGRPDTASSGGETPITPFVGMSLHGTGSDMTSMPPWNGAQSFAYTPATSNGHTGSVDFGLMSSLGKTAGGYGGYGLQQNDKDAARADQYLATLQNSLGLYNVPHSASTTAINPAAVLDPSTFSSVFGNMSVASAPNTDGLSAAASMHVLQSPRSAVMPLPSTHPAQHQRLIFPPQQQKVGRVGTSALGQRPRAGTAMASLGGGHPSPRHMRSTPNLHLSPSPSLDGSQHARAYGGSASVTSTPVKTIRKIASNRRLTMLNPVTPDIPSSVHSLGAALPASPVSPTKRGRNVGGGVLSSSASMGNLSGAVGGGGGGGGFEFINYGIEDADELCSAVAPSGSYKVPLKGFGEDGDDDEGGYGSGGAAAGDDFDDDDGAGSGGTDNETSSLSPHRARRPRSSTNRSGPRWEHPNLPPLPSENIAAADGAPAARQIKRQKSDIGTMLAGRKKSPSMSNLRRRD